MLRASCSLKTSYQNTLATLGQKSKSFARRMNVLKWRKNFKPLNSNKLLLPRHNLQRLYKIQSQFKHKTRKRKFKSRVGNEGGIRWSSRALGRPRQFLFMGFRARKACRLTFKLLLGAERALMATKQKL
jgi:hypothetical protein